MQALRDLIASPFEKRVIDLKDSAWHAGIPRKPGWYFIETDTPLHVFTELPSPVKTYHNAEGDMVACRNYDLRKRAHSLADVMGTGDRLISTPGTRVVYSGMAKHLSDRAKEHTFAHLGTVGLALARYEVLHAYKWCFYFQENRLPSISARHNQITLKLGEQIWRAQNGWPLLCSG